MMENDLINKFEKDKITDITYSAQCIKDDELENNILKIIKNSNFDLCEFFNNIDEKNFSNGKKVKDFFVILSKAKFEWNNNNIEATITVGGDYKEKNEKTSKEENILYIAINGKARNAFEGKFLRGDFPSLGIPEEINIKEFLSHTQNSVEVGAFRYIAGGSIPVLELKNGKRYAVLIRRDAKAPTDSECFTTSTGLCEYLEEWKDPRLTIAREFYEEIQIFSSDLNIHYNPNFKFWKRKEDYTKQDNFFNLVRQKYEQKLNKLKKELNTGTTCEKDIDVSIFPLGKDTLKIKLHDEKQNPEKEESIEIEGELVLDPVSGALDLVGSAYLKLCNVEDISNLKIVDFDTESQGNFLFREIHLIDGDNLKNLIGGEDFCTSVFVTTYDGSRVIINYIESMHYNSCPRLTPPLRGSIVNCYKLFFNSSDNVKFNWQEEHRLNSLCFPDQLNKDSKCKNSSNERTNTSFEDTFSNLNSDKSLRYSPSPYKVKSWKDNLNWKDHIKDMIAAESQEFKKIVDKFIQLLDNFVPEEFASLPYFTEHYSTHVRNVISNAFMIMNLKKEKFREIDYLIIMLSALIHDLGQFNPQAKYANVAVRDDPELLEQFYDRLIDAWVEENEGNEYRNLFGNSSDKSKFARLILNIAKYHPKAMLFDKEYEEKFKKSVVGENMHDGYLADILAAILNDDKEKPNDDKEKPNDDKEKLNDDKEKLKQHYLLLAAILQIADGIDIQKYRNPSLESFKQKFISLTTNEEVEGRIETIDALIKDVTIESVAIEEKNNKYCIVFKCDKGIKIKCDVKKGTFERNKDKNSDLEKIFGYFENTLQLMGSQQNIIKEQLLSTKNGNDLTELIKEKIINPTLTELALVDNYLKEAGIEFDGVKIVENANTNSSCASSQADDECKCFNNNNISNEQSNAQKYDEGCNKGEFLKCKGEVVGYHRKDKSEGNNNKERLSLSFTLKICKDGTKIVSFENEKGKTSEDEIFVESQIKIEKIEIEKDNNSLEDKLIREFIVNPQLENFSSKWEEKTKNRSLFPDKDSVKSLISKIWNGKVEPWPE